MNRDDIIRMAREAGVHHINLDEDYIKEFLDFAELVAASERSKIRIERNAIFGESNE